MSLFLRATTALRRAADSASDIAAASARIFGTFRNPDGNQRTGRKVLQKRLVGEKLVAWYPEDVTRIARSVDPSFRTMSEDHWAAKLQRLRLKGKGPPKKGSGKRASKRKR